MRTCVLQYPRVFPSPDRPPEQIPLTAIFSLLKGQTLSVWYCLPSPGVHRLLQVQKVIDIVRPKIKTRPYVHITAVPISVSPNNK